MDKLLIVIGPTASGKTDLGLLLAKKFDGEILSADSRQVYKYMDIGTGKDTRHFQWGLDLVKPDEPFSASQYVDYARKVIKDIWERKRLPIIVGGTGLYIKELLEPSQTLHIKPNQKLRRKLAGYSISRLQSELQKSDPEKWERMNSSDRQNPRRLIRAIEVAGKSLFFPEPLSRNYLIVGLIAPYDFLYQRIDKRVDDRLENGVEKERVELSKYKKLPATIGYQGETDQEWKFAEHAYARRQMSYFKSKFKDAIWFDITQDGYRQKIVDLVSSWYIDGDEGG